MFRSFIWRFILPPLLAAGVLAYFAVPYTDRLLADWFSSDVQLRARMVMNSMQESLPSLVENPDASALHRYVDRIVVDQRLLGIFICRPDGMQLIRTPRVPENVSCDSTSGIANEGSLMLQAPSGSVQVSAFTERFKGEAPYRIGMVHDLSFIDRRQTTARDYLMLFGGDRGAHPGAVPGAGGVAAAATLGQRC